MSDTPIFQKNVAVLNAVSMATSQTSSSFDGSEARTFGIQASWTGTNPVGSLAVSASTDGITWTSIYTQAITGNSGSIIDNLGPLPYPYLQASYVATSGTGTLTARICSKQ